LCRARRTHIWFGVGNLSRERSRLQVEIWNESQWRSSRAEYDALLAQSSADRLFLSSDWLTLWWESLAPQSDGDVLHMLAARDGGTLVGLMPVFRDIARRQGLRYRVANLLGGCVRQARGVFSEYLDIVALPGRETDVRNACVGALLRLEDYSEIAVATTPAYEDWYAVFRRYGRWRGGYVRVIDHMTSYQADLGSGFEAYLESLSANARRSIFNLRKRLQTHGQIQFERVASADWSTGLEILNGLHRQRWGSPAFGPMTTRLQQQLMQAWSDTGRVQMSKLNVDGKTVSMLHDLRLGNIQYNIQMGFDPNFDSSLSLGLLHLGYAMETAAAEGVATYDFLAGTGRVADYKKRIANHSRQLASVQYFHGPVVSMVFRAHDYLRRLRRAKAPVLLPNPAPASSTKQSSRS